MTSFTIKDLENLSGVKAHTIRIWEQRYNFLKPQRTHTNIRYYSSGELKTILNVALLNKYGVKISHIDRMDEKQITERLVHLSGGEAENERLVNELITQMIDLDADSFEALLNKQVSQTGLTETINEVVFPFLEKTGMLWAVGKVNAAQEHVTSNIIRQKLLAGIDHLHVVPANASTVVMFLPEADYNELGLLYMYYLAKKEGIKVLYLGANVAIEDLAFIVQMKKPDYVYTHLSVHAGNPNIEKVMEKIQQLITQVPVVISGAFSHFHKKDFAANIFVKHSLYEAYTQLFGRATFTNV